MAPAGTPKSVIDLLNKEINKILDAAWDQGGLGTAGRRSAGDDA